MPFFGRGTNSYHGRTRKRMRRTERLVRSIKATLDRWGRVPEDYEAIEAELFSLAEAQRHEHVTDDAGEHRDTYADMIQRQAENARALRLALTEARQRFLTVALPVLEGGVHRDIRTAKLAEFESMLGNHMMREPVTGPHARPWKERRTTKPAGYTSMNWGARWQFEEPNEAGLIAVPEECVGTLFPGDKVEINGRTWTVGCVRVDHDWPLVEVQQLDR
jgi:hypothetical protein